MKQQVFFTGWIPIFHQPAATATRSATFFMRLLVIHGANVRATVDPVQRSKNREVQVEVVGIPWTNDVQ